MLDNMTIAVLIPAYNEELLIGKVLAAMPEFVDKIIVVDDNSTDRTATIAHTFNAVVISHRTNKGVGIALQSGISKALEFGVDILVNIDADNQFNPADIEKLVRPIISGEAAFVTASRFKDKKLYPEMSKIKFWGNKLVSLMVSRIARQRFHDVSCGFRAYSKDTLMKLNLFGKFTYTHESILMLAFQNINILEMALAVRGKREIGESKQASNVITFGIKTLRIILQTFLDYEPFKLFHFVGMLFIFIAFACGSFTIVHYVLTGFFSPYKFVGFAAAGCLTIYVLFFILGVTTDSLAKIRRNQEKILYFLKKNAYERMPDKRNSHE